MELNLKRSAYLIYRPLPGVYIFYQSSLVFFSSAQNTELQIYEIPSGFYTSIHLYIPTARAAPDKKGRGCVEKNNLDAASP